MRDPDIDLDLDDGGDDFDLEQWLADERAARERHFHRRLVVTGALGLVIGVAGAAALSAATTGPPVAVPTRPSASASLVPLWTPGPEESRDDLRDQQLTFAARDALRRVVPEDAILSVQPEFRSSGGHMVAALVRLNGRTGVVRLRTVRGGDPFTCENHAPGTCTVTTGSGGERIWTVEGEVRSPRGEPPNLQAHVRIDRAGGSWVWISVDNASDLPSAITRWSTPPRTGQLPPLTVGQLLLVAADPALDICATLTDGRCTA